jgi:galactose mutarotase-like enzyme
MLPPGKALSHLLEARDLVVEVVPACGGGVTRFAFAGLPVFRRNAVPPAECRVDDLACFPLVPFSNRIARGRLPAAHGDVQLAATRLDNCFGGWSRAATLAWPETGIALDIAASETLGTLVLYTPPDAGFFCAEPASRLNNAFQLAHSDVPDTGAREFPPGRRSRAACAARRACAKAQHSLVIEKILAHLDAKADAGQASRPPPCRAPPARASG